MLHPSYSHLIDVVNSENPEEPIIQSRYSIVIATAKRARQLIAGAESEIEATPGKKPLSIAVEELNTGKIKITGEDDNIVEMGHNPSFNTITVDAGDDEDENGYDDEDEEIEIESDEDDEDDTDEDSDDEE